MTAPFTSMGEAALCARVAVALCKLLCKDEVIRNTKPSIIIGIATSRLDGLRFATLRLALLSLNAAQLAGKSSNNWLTEVVYRDMMGFTLRSCFYSEYKATRRYPRVTNRGVTPPIAACSPVLPTRVQKGKLND